MGQRGRPPVLDEAKKREILAILTVGCSRRTAARYVGCTASTIQNTAERDAHFARKAAAGQLQHRSRPDEEHPQRGQEGAVLAGGGLGPGTRLPRALLPAAVRMSLPSNRFPRCWAQFTDIIVAEVPVARYRQRIVKRLETLTRGLCGPTAPGPTPESSRETKSPSPLTGEGRGEG